MPHEPMLFALSGATVSGKMFSGCAVFPSTRFVMWF